MAIRGTSAGGLTALGALIRSDRFAGAATWYGVTDLEALAADTHDFESRYLDSLVGPWPEARRTYRARSPIHAADRVTGSVLLLQGVDDPVVPADQSERFAALLDGAGGALPVGAVRGGVPRFPAGRHHRGQPPRRAGVLPLAVRPAGRCRPRPNRSPEPPPGVRPATPRRALRTGTATCPVVLSTVPTDRLRMHRGAPSSDAGTRWSGYPPWARRALASLQALSPEGRDAFLYGCSAVFAGITAFAVGIPLYRQWGQMAVGPYAVATVIMAVVAHTAGAGDRSGRPEPRRGGRP